MNLHGQIGMVSLRYPSTTTARHSSDSSWDARLGLAWVLTSWLLLARVLTSWLGLAARLRLGKLRLAAILRFDPI